MRKTTFEEEWQLIELDLQRIGIYERHLQNVSINDENKELVFAILSGWIFRTRFALVAASACFAIGTPVLAEMSFPLLRRLLCEMPSWWVIEREPEGLVDGTELLREHVGSAISELVCPGYGDEFIALAIDSRLGGARFAIVLRLTKTKHPAACEVLISLLNDPTVAPFAAEALGRAKYFPAVPALQELVESDDENVARESKVALRKIGRSRRQGSDTPTR